MKHGKLIFWSLTAALAGFLFGFDTIVISGAEETFQKLWELDGTMHGLAMSMALWGTVIGALLGGIPTTKYGRRKTLIWVGVLYFVSAVGSCLAPEVYSFMFARFIGGLGVGTSTIAAPLFIAEISPAGSRGKLAGMFQFNIVFGILVAFLANFIIAKTVDPGIAWRVMLGAEAVPALLYTILSFSLPESPRWLITHAKNRAAGKAIFCKINPEMSDAEIEKLVCEVEQTKITDKKNSGFWTRRMRTPIMLAFFIAFFNQLSGINIILYFAPRLLGMAGLKGALMASIALGVTNLVFTFIGLWLIDKLGRRSLLYIGSFGYILSLGICSYAFLTTPSFKIAAAAGNLQSSIVQMEKLADFNAQQKDARFFSDEDAAKAKKEYAGAQEALAAASKTPGYTGSEVLIPMSATVKEVKDIATIAEIEAAKILGPMSFVVLICLISFIAAHAIGQGAVIWVFISEIFPNDHRAAGQALGSSTHWVCAAGLTFLFPIAMSHFEPGILFGFFCFMMVLQLIWVKTMVPETKGVKLEEMQANL